MDYWHILVLACARLECNYTYDRVHDLSENHIKLRAIMGLGSWDEQTKFKWRTIRDNLWKRVKQLAREIDRIAGNNGPNYVFMRDATIPPDSLVNMSSGLTRRRPVGREVRQLPYHLTADH